MSLDLADRISIHETLARLAHAVDGQDWDTYLSFFTDDAVMEPGFAPPSAGSQAIRQFLMATEGGTRGKRHVSANVYIDGTATEAVASSYLVVIEREDLPKVVATARIVDTLVKHAGAWKVVKHQVSVDPGMFKAMG